MAALVLCLIVTTCFTPETSHVGDRSKKKVDIIPYSYYV